MNKKLKILVIVLVAIFIFPFVPKVTVSAASYTLYWPVPTSAAAIGKYSSPFGKRTSPTSGASTNHRGIDIPVKSGTTVYAAYDGTVVTVGKSNARGNYVVLYHSSIGLSTLYQHLTCATVQKGESVSGGSQIAVSGNTGVGTGAHLHFGVMKGKATKADNDQPSYDMAIDPLGSSINYVPASGTIIVSDNPDDYPYPTRDLFYTSPVKTGNDVKWVQAVLHKLGYTIAIDGSFGPATRDVVKKFQSDNGLSVDGSCGPATRSKLKEKWEQKKSGKINVTLQAWLSNNEFGQTPDKYVVGDQLYLNYKIFDSDTGNGLDSEINKTYSVSVVLYGPTGSQEHNATFNNDNSWIAIKRWRAGLYKGKVVVSGDISLSVEVSCNVVYNCLLQSSTNIVSLNLNEANTASIKFTPTGAYPGDRGISWSSNNEFVSASSGGWSSDSSYFTLNLTGLKRGSTDFTVNLYENYTGNKEIVATSKIHIEVTSNSYTISYNANGGSGASPSQTKYYNENLTLSSTKPSRTGYSFLGWSTSSSATSATYSAGGTYSVNSSATLYAVWKVNTYTITYNANGGSGAPSSQTKTYNQNLTLSSARPTRSGYTFLGWSKSSTATSASYSAGGTFTDNADTVLYAVWNSTPTTYTVSYNANGGSGAPTSQTKYHNQSLTLSSVKPSRTGYSFLGWSTSDSATSATYSAGGTYTSNSSATLYAVWKLIPVTNYKIRVPRINASLGQTIDVPIYIENNPGIVGMTLFVDYNSSVLRLTNVKDGELLGVNSHKPEYNSPYTLAWANDTATSNYTGSGVIATLTFEVKSNVAIGDYPITIAYDYDSYGIYDKDLNRIAFTIENNSISVSNIICGDVNNDGIVNNLDRVYLTRYLAAWSEYENIDAVAADVNLDGIVNNLDRVILTRHLADWSDYKSLPYK